MSFKGFARRSALVGVGLAAAGGAMAQTATGVDVTDVVATISAQATPIAAIGGAVLAIFVGIKAFKWVRRAM
jgi:hypothetical protein